MTRDDRSSEILGERYRLVRKLAEGGMGAVYLAEHESIGGKFAVKLLRSELAATDLFIKRFRREAKANAAIRHRNIVKVFDAGVAPWGEPYMIMEYLEGESLKDLLRRNGPLPFGFAVDVARQALEGLHAAHEAGIVHRDLKPENLVLVYEGGGAPTVKIIDFGISKYETDESMDLTRTGSILGTARYMSLEQAEGRDDVDRRTDLYSMGVVLYHALTGGFPYDVAGRWESLAEVLRRPPVHPSEHCAGFPEEMSRIVLKALSPDPAHRYRTALEMARELAVLDLTGACERKEPTAASGEELSPVVGEIGPDDDTRPARPDPPPRPRSVKRAWIARADGSGRRRVGTRVALVVGIALAVVGGLAVALLSGALGGYLSPEEGGRAATPPAPSPPPKAPSPAAEGRRGPSPEGGALVTVTGAPSGSRVFWDGVLVPMNPFRVERRDTIAPLRVEADGYETFGIAVVPEDDQVIHVDMVPKKAATASAGGRRGGALLGRGAASTGGERAMDAQQAVITRNKPELKRCYDQALARGDAPRDSDLVVHFRLEVGENGRVVDARLGGSGAGVDPFRLCLEREVRSWFFLPTDAKASVVSFSFAFTTKA